MSEQSELYQRAHRDALGLCAALSRRDPQTSALITGQYADRDELLMLLSAVAEWTVALVSLYSGIVEDRRPVEKIFQDIALGIA